ncbi:hypothetical protein FRC12_008197, partial [Ceratobasidium sp. 428]
MPFTNATRLFNDYGFRYGLCDYSDQNTRINIACSSRLGFSTAASRIWRTLESIQPLLMLLDLTIGQPAAGVVKIILPRWNEGTFKRFQHYSSFVQSLTVSKQWKCPIYRHFRLDSWSTISQEARRGPLLPNLRELIFLGEFVHEIEIALWISVLTPQSLKVLAICPSNDSGFLSPSNVATVFALLPQRCPRLQKLTHNLSVIARPFEENDLLPEILPEQVATRQVLVPLLAQSHLQASRYLTYLSIGGHFVTVDTLTALSCLPELYELEIDQVLCHNRGLCTTFRECRLEARAFPRLQQFTLASSNLEDFLAVWTLTPLVFDLTKIHLKYGSYNDYSRPPIYEEGLFGPLMLAIAAGSQQIKDITIDTRPLNRPLLTDPETTSWALMINFPLLYLRLHNLRAEPVFFSAAYNFWPGLLILDLPSQQLTLDHLTYLSRLPELQLLCAAGLKDILDPVPDVSTPAHSPLHTIKLTRLLTSRVHIKSAENVAR